MRFVFAPAPDEATEESLSEFLPEDVVQYRDEDADRLVLERFCRSRAEAEQAREQLAARLHEVDGLTVPEPAIVELADRDWVESWKASLPVLRVTDRIVVKPSWRTHRRAAGECVIELDPGLSFGTGHHFTTRSCLQMLDDIGRVGRRLSLCDLGCGTGILAIAAAQLGYGDILAVDNDPVAVETAQANSRRNGVGARVRVLQADADHFRPARRFDVVAANLLSETLVKSAARIAALVSLSPPGLLIASGILRTQYPAVKAAYTAMGFRETRDLSDGEWQTGCFLSAQVT